MSSEYGKTGFEEPAGCSAAPLPTAFAPWQDDTTMNSTIMLPLFQVPEAASAEDFNVIGGEIFATFSPWASWLSDGDPFAPAPTILLPASADGSAGAEVNADSTVAVSS